MAGPQSGMPQRVRDTNAELYGGTVTSGQPGAFELSSTLLDVVVSEVRVQNDPTNVAGQDILVGNQHVQVWRLQPGDEIILPVDRVATVWVNFSGAGITISWLAVG